MKRYTSIRLSAALATALVVSTAGLGAARAGTLLRWFGNDARNAGMGNGGYSLGTGPGNLLGNPALMSFSPAGIWVGFSAIPTTLSIDVDARDSAYDVPDSAYEIPPDAWSHEVPQNGDSAPREHVYQDRPVPTSQLLNEASSTDNLKARYQLTISYIKAPFWPGFRIGVGVSLPLPAGMSWNTWYSDEREQHFSNKLHFARFGEFDTILSVYPGLSYAPLDWLSLGFSLRMDIGIAMDAGMFVPEEGNFEYAYVSTNGDIVPIIRPIAGLGVKTPVGLRFGLTYRHESYADIRLNAWARFREQEETLADGSQRGIIQQRHHIILGYEPTEIALAAAYEFDPVAFEITVGWERWSGFLDHHANDWSHPSMDPEDGAQEPGWDDDWKDPSFSDVATVRGGLEWLINEHVALRAGAGYFPSPVPAMDGRYNYVDNDLLLYSLGGGFSIPLAGHIVTIDLAAQMWHMLSKTVEKNLDLTKEEGGIIDEVPAQVYGENGQELAPGLQSNNPGLPGYSFGGLAFNFMIVLGTDLAWEPK